MALPWPTKNAQGLVQQPAKKTHKGARSFVTEAKYSSSATNLLRLLLPLLLLLLLLGEKLSLPGINHARCLLECFLNGVGGARPHVGNGATHEPPASQREFRLTGY